MVTSNVSLVRAPNPSPLTLTGTNSYIIDGGNGEAICIDPGPPIASHIAALEDRLGVVAIVLTHSHPDHAPAAQQLAAATGAKIYAHPLSSAKHDVDLKDGDRIRAGAAELRVIEAPGHTADHLVFYEPNEGALFTGDTILGEGYVVIAPPHGDMRAYQRTLRRLLDEFGDARVIYGGHGEPVLHPLDTIRDYIAHRKTRQRELIRTLESGPKTIPELVGAIYAQTDRRLWPAAARQMLAYLQALEREGRIRSIELSRKPNVEESAILNPDLSRLVGPEQAELVASELGSEMIIPGLTQYELVDL